SPPDQTAAAAGCSGGQRQSARAFRQTARRRANRSACHHREPRSRPASAVASRCRRTACIGSIAMMRLLNICVIAALVLAAADVSKIKFESARQADRLAKLRMEITREHDAIAALRAEWSKLDTPARIADLVRRHLALKPVEATQFDAFDI